MTNTNSARDKFNLWHLAVHQLLVIGTLLISSTAASENIVIPLTAKSGWERLVYTNIKPNQISFEPTGMRLTINNSAGPIIYPLEKPALIDSLSFTINISGDIQLDHHLQGEQGVDDFVFRLGLVYEGERTLNFIQRATAADWVKRLYQLAPKDVGVSYIEFYNIYSDSRLRGGQRQTSGGLIIENFTEFVSLNEDMQISIATTNTHRVLALWISADGDDTNSSFDVVVKQILLTKREN